MAQDNVQCLAQDLYLTQALNTAIGAGLKNQPKNTANAYKKPQRDFKVSIQYITLS